uniref:Uncharacterized protein n=1 Tax=mine drainage metagenome TaxID=410659 RepID=E6QJU1_9ZZZZ
MKSPSAPFKADGLFRCCFSILTGTAPTLQSGPDWMPGYREAEGMIFVSSERRLSQFSDPSLSKMSFGVSFRLKRSGSVEWRTMESASS